MCVELVVFDDAWCFSDASSDAGSDSDASGEGTPSPGSAGSESAVLCFVVAGPKRAAVGVHKIGVVRGATGSVRV